MRLALFLLLSLPAWAAWGGASAMSCLAQSKVNTHTSLACTVMSENIEVGNVAIAWAAMDNLASADGNTTDCTSMTDSASNSWIPLREYTYAEGAAAAGATVCMFYSVLTTQLNSGSSTITLTHGAVQASGLSVHEFTIGAGNVVNIVGTPQDLGNNSTDPGSLTVGSLTSAEYLWVRAIALERSDTTCTATVGGLFTLTNNQGTTGAGAATNMHTCGEWDIATATTNTSDPTATSVDNASVFIALREAAPAATTGAGWYGTNSVF